MVGLEEEDEEETWVEVEIILFSITVPKPGHLARDF
jgi:hypothetical protein